MTKRKSRIEHVNCNQTWVIGVLLYTEECQNCSGYRNHNPKSHRIYFFIHPRLPRLLSLTWYPWLLLPLLTLMTSLTILWLKSWQPIKKGKLSKETKIKSWPIFQWQPDHWTEWDEGIRSAAHGWQTERYDEPVSVGPWWGRDKVVLGVKYCLM